MSTPLVLVVLFIAVVAGAMAPGRFLDPPPEDAQFEQSVAWLACRALVLAATVLFALRMYQLVDAVADIAGEDFEEDFYGSSEGEVIAQLLPQLLFETGILLALTAGLYALSRRPLSRSR